jgi:hypothetical protein
VWNEQRETLHHHCWSSGNRLYALKQTLSPPRRPTSPHPRALCLQPHSPALDSTRWAKHADRRGRTPSGTCRIKASDVFHGLPQTTDECWKSYLKMGHDTSCPHLYLPHSLSCCHFVRRRLANAGVVSSNISQVISIPLTTAERQPPPPPDNTLGKPYVAAEWLALLPCIRDIQRSKLGSETG